VPGRHGPTLHGALLDAGLADRVVCYVAATVLGRHALPVFAMAGPDAIAAGAHWRLLDVRRLDDDVRLDYDPRPA
jgi:diaminohydroxyphosphoribosylaminopyrimidine deaminase/5-amino-6-(5-phosphoribosylamino)uracil reductase